MKLLAAHSRDRFSVTVDLNKDRPEDKGTPATNRIPS